MFKRTRILSLGLAMALFMAQTAQAEILITPLDKESVPAVGGQAGTQGETGPGYGGNLREYSTKTPVPQPGNSALGNGGNGPAAGNGTGSFQSGSQDTERALPAVEAEAAILYDVTHDTVLFEKNADKKLYPASITKLMTALLVLENADLDSTVTFSKTAVTNLEAGAVTLGLQEGDQVSVKDCLYGLLLKSANEVANGLAEHVGGSLQGFGDMMNKKAEELGCTGTHFVNPSGLNDPEHYTTARDMAKIARAAFENKTLCEISSALSYTFPATKKAAARTITPGHKMLYADDSRYYDGIVGGKTGYTSLAGNTLVTCVEKDGVRMVAVVLKAKGSHYTDTKALLDYGYEKGEDAGNGNALYHKWVKNGDSWYFKTADGQFLKNCLAAIDGVEYGFDAAGNMLTGWQKFGDDWYYFGSGGAMVKNGWRQDGERWFYLGGDGAMVRDSWIDNLYYVGADGVWLQQ